MVLADHLTDNDFFAADAIIIFLAAVVGVAVYLAVNFALNRLKLPFYPFVISLVAGALAAWAVYFALREYRTDIADWWYRTVGGE